MKRYNDILHLSRPASRHPRMHRQDRAKLFAPFAALSGFGDSVRERERLLFPRAVLAEDAQLRLDRKLRRLEPGDYVTAVYFLPEKTTAEEGRYLTVSSLFLKIDEVRQRLCLDGASIPLEDLVELTGMGEAEGHYEPLQ